MNETKSTYRKFYLFREYAFLPNLQAIRAQPEKYLDRFSTMRSTCDIPSMLLLRTEREQNLEQYLMG